MYLDENDVKDKTKWKTCKRLNKNDETKITANISRWNREGDLTVEKRWGSVSFAQKQHVGISLKELLFTFIPWVHFRACTFYFYLSKEVQSVLLL